MSPSVLLDESATAVDGLPYSPRIAIIGAGIAGVVLSIALIQQNPALRVTIFEKRPAISELGVGVGIGPNAVRTMSRISPEMRQAYDEIVTLNEREGTLNTDFDIYCGDGDERGQFLGEMLAREGIPHGGLGRIALMEALVSLLPKSVGVVFNKKVKDIFHNQVSPDGQVKISFTDNTEAFADAVVGCDGIHSICRSLIMGKNHESFRPTYTGRYGFRAIIPMDQAIKAIGPEAQNRRLIVGHGRHILFFPVLKGKGMNVAAFVDAGGKPWEHEKWVVPAEKEDLLIDFQGFDDASMHLLSLIQNTDKWALFDHPDAPTFVDSSGMSCLLGDAAHASSPSCGAGVGMLFEDAYILSSLMRPELLRSRKDIERAFRAYDVVRRPRSQELVRRSRRQGGVFCLKVTDTKGLLQDFQSNMAWVWDVDLDEMLAKAEKAFVSFRTFEDYHSSR